MALDVKSLEGNETAEDYTRKTSSKGRWAQAWEVVKANFGKFVLINIFVFLTFIPAIAVMVIRLYYIAAMGAQYPFNANTGIGYPAYPGTHGLAEQIYLSADVIFYSLLIAACSIACLGISGGAYSIKKLLNTQGEFTIKGFFHGIKVGYFNTLFPVVVFMLFFYSTVLVGDWKDLSIANGASAAGPVAAYVAMIIVTVIVGIYCAWLLAVGISYKVKFLQLLKNASVLLIGTPLQSIFFAAFALIPIWLLLIGQAVYLLEFLVITAFVFVGFSFILVVWMGFTQWIFDSYVTPNLKHSVEESKAPKSAKELAREKEEEEKRVAMELLAAGKSELICKPILPISDDAPVTSLGSSFNRADLNRIFSEREKLNADIAAYEQEHLSDPVYAEYNKLFSEREKVVKPEGKKGKKKKVSSDNLLR